MLGNDLKLTLLLLDVFLETGSLCLGFGVGASVRVGTSARRVDALTIVTKVLITNFAACEPIDMVHP